MVQIRRSRELEERSRAARTPMTVDELLARFPEVPRDLRDEPVLAEYVKAFGPLLRVRSRHPAWAAAAMRRTCSTSVW